MQIDVWIKISYTQYANTDDIIPVESLYILNDILLSLFKS